MSEKKIAAFLKQLRKTSGYSANEVIDKLKDYDIDISAKTLYGYEGGVSMLNADIFIALCRIYKCDNPMDIFGTISLKPNEISLVEKYRDLDSDGQIHVDTVLQWEATRATALSERDDHIKALEAEQASRSVPRRIFAYYGKIAAAGTWVDFSDLIAGTKEYYLTDENANADYTIGVNGDSMEPTYYDGDIVFVKSANHLNVGDIGIFQKDNSIYIKEVGENGLISHKWEKYPPMINGGDVRCWGRVVGKVTEDMIIAD